MVHLKYIHLVLCDHNILFREVQSDVYSALSLALNLMCIFMHFCPGTMTTQAESINSDLQRGLDRRLRHTQH